MRQKVFRGRAHNILFNYWFTFCRVSLTSHFLNLRILKKILLYTGLGLLVIVVSLALSVFLFKDKIIRNFIEAANKNLNTPVKIGKIDVSVFQKFPQLSIVLTDVSVEDSHPGQYPLLTADKIAFQLNPLEVYRGNYNIKGLEIENSETNLKINKKGVNNYTILKENKSAETAGEVVGFELKNVLLKNALVRYVDQKNEEDLILSSKNLSASIRSSGDVYTIEAVGELTTKLIKVKNSSVLEGKSFDISADLIYDDGKRLLTIEPSILNLKGSEFAVEGTYDWAKTPVIDITVDGKDTNIQTILSLLPENASQQFMQYQSKGETYFSAVLKGPITSTKNPGLSIDFGLKEATIFHPDTKAQITHANVEGSFASSNLTDLHKASLVLKNITGSLNGEAFEANLVIQDFIDSNVILKFKGKVDAASLIGFYPIENIKALSGSLLTDFSFEGKLSWLKSRSTAQKATTNGTIEMQNLNFLYGESKLAIKNLNGSLQFTNNDLALSNVSLQAGNSDFVFNGFFKNIITFLLFENQPIGIEADMKSNFIDVDELFQVGFASKKSSSDYQFSISPNLNLNFNCDVQSLRYQRFSAHKIKGDLLVKDEVAVSRNTKLKTMGGDLSFSAIIDAKNHKAIDVLTSAKLAGIYLDSVFYVFKNFDQDFIEDKHLKGQATADVSVELTLNENLKLFQETLIADISMTIKNGELNNFEPLKSLNKYLDDEGLSHLRFADLKNDIHIEKKTVYIPQMQVRSNVTAIQISGTHTFDQHIDYRLITPLRNKKKIDVTEAASALEENNGQLKLFLKITGTTDNYKVQYDTEAFRKKLASEMKKEVQELKDAFKTKGKQKQKELELEKDEYFDWDN
jgi:hypothetical protein